jgi:hypothetical protein
MGTLNELALAYLARERQRLGIPAEERAQEQHDVLMDSRRQATELAAEEAPLRAAERQAKIKQALADATKAEGANAALTEVARIRAEAARELNPAKKALMEAQAQQAEARAGLYNEQAANPGAFRGSGGAGGGGSPRLVQSGDTWRWVMPGEQGVPLATPPAVRQTAGMADTVQKNIADLRVLAQEGVVNGPLSGRISTAAQSVLGPHGGEGDFDFKANALVDVVYLKSGKQINANEMALLRRLIPTRTRGNIERQIDLFEEYATSLLEKYAGTNGAPATPAAPPKAPGGGGGGKRRRFNPATGKLE